MDALTLAIPLFAGFLTAMTVSELVNPRTADGSLSPLVLSAYFVEIGLIGTDLALAYHRRQFFDNYTYRTTTVDPSAVQRRFTDAEAALTAGHLVKALSIFQSIVREYPDSILFPRALYHSARIRVILNSVDQALFELLLLVRDYPEPKIYDRAQKTLAEIYLQQGNFDSAVTHLDQIFFIGSDLSHEEVDFFRCQIYREWAVQKPDMLPELLKCLQEVIRRYPGSDQIGLYRLYMVHTLLQAGLIEQARVELGAIDTEGMAPSLFKQLEKFQEQLGD
jgi:tetratricopeptide (TPR) repeat protein